MHHGLQEVRSYLGTLLQRPDQIEDLSSEALARYLRENLNSDFAHVPT